MPKCGLQCTPWSRVVGYWRPLNDENGRPLWNPGKQAEFKDRVSYNLAHPRRHAEISGPPQPVVWHPNGHPTTAAWG